MEHKEHMEQHQKPGTADKMSCTECMKHPMMAPTLMQCMKNASGGGFNIPLANLGPNTIKKFKKLIKHEVKHAICLTCPDKSHVVKQIVKTKLTAMISDACGIKGETGNMCEKCVPTYSHTCPGNCQCGCKCGCKCGCTCDPKGCKCKKGCKGDDCSEECCAMQENIKSYARNVCKFVLDQGHDEIKKVLGCVLGSFKMLKGCLPPTYGKHGKSFQKACAILMHKLHTKGHQDEEKCKEMCKKYWVKYCENVEHAVKKRSKRCAKRAMFYAPDKSCDFLAKQVGIKCITHGLTKAFHATAIVGCNMLHATGEEKKGDILMEESCPPGIRLEWKMKLKFWRKCLKQMSGHMVHEWMKTYGEMCKMAIPIAKEIVENKFKECNAQDPVYCVKMIGKIVKHVMFGCYNENKDKAAIETAVKKYCAGMLTACNKACLKECRRRVKTGLQLLGGIYDHKALYIGARWGGLVCCKAHCKEGCKREMCAEFTKKWIQENKDTLLEAVKAGNELINECKELGNNEFLKCRIMTQGTLWYLKFNQQPGKFNRDDFKKFWDNLVSKNRALIDCCHKSLEETLKKATEGSNMKIEKQDYVVMMMALLDNALPRECLPHKMMSHYESFPGMRKCKHECLTCNLPGMPMTGHMMSPGMMSQMMPGMPMMPGTHMPGMMHGMMMPEMMGMMMMRPEMMGEGMMPEMMGQGMMMPGMMPGMMMPGMMPGMMMPGMMPGMMPEMMMGMQQKHMEEMKKK